MRNRSVTRPARREHAHTAPPRHLAVRIRIESTLPPSQRCAPGSWPSIARRPWIGSRIRPTDAGSARHVLDLSPRRWPHQVIASCEMSFPSKTPMLEVGATMAGDGSCCAMPSRNQGSSPIRRPRGRSSCRGDPECAVD